MIKRKRTGGDYWGERDPTPYIKKLTQEGKPIPSWVKSLEEQGAPRKYWAKASEDADVIKKLTRIAAIKKAALNNKKYNVASDTSPDPSPANAASGILYGGVGGGGAGYDAMDVPEGAFSFSDIPSIVWVILAVGGGYFLMKSSKGK